MSKKQLSTRFIATAAMIAAIYVVLTVLAAGFGLANGAIQVRFSEVLTILPLLTPAAIPGVTIGCLLSNILTGCIVPDIIFGTCATLLGSIGTYLIGQAARKAMASTKATRGSAPKNVILTGIVGSIPPILANTIIVPLVLRYGYHLPDALPFLMLTVCIGEVISCCIFGVILLAALQPARRYLFAEA